MQSLITSNELNTVFASTKTKHREVARIENLDPSVCPYCGGKMKPSVASGHKVYVCFEDNHVAPSPDENQSEPELVVDDATIEDNLFPETTED